MTKPKTQTRTAKPPKRAPLSFIAPCLAQVIATPPSGANWIHETKYDGYRVQVHVSDGGIRFFTRNGIDWTEKFGNLAIAFDRMRVSSAIIDGEAVVEDNHGVAHFQELAEALQAGRAQQISYVAFDLLSLNGVDVRASPLLDRKKRLQHVLAQLPNTPRIRLSPHLTDAGPELLQQACKAGHEGIVSKRIDLPYRSGRLGDWVKAKCVKADPFVVIGFVASPSAPGMIGSLVVGYYDKRTLIYAGRVGSGFTATEARSLKEGLSSIPAPPPPLTKTLTREQREGVQWIEPRFVAQIEYRAWTREGILRHSTFKHFRDDKRPEQITKPASTVVRG